MSDNFEILERSDVPDVLEQARIEARAAVEERAALAAQRAIEQMIQFRAMKTTKAINEMLAVYSERLEQGVSKETITQAMIQTRHRHIAIKTIGAIPRDSGLFNIGDKVCMYYSGNFYHMDGDKYMDIDNNVVPEQEFYKMKAETLIREIAIKQTGAIENESGFFRFGERVGVYYTGRFYDVSTGELLGQCA